LVVIVSGPDGLMVTLKVGLVKVCWMGLESTTVTTKVYVPVWVGVPEITPKPCCKATPEGKFPL